MRARPALVVALVLAASIPMAGAQTNVDRLADRLAALTLTTVEGWKISPDLAKSGLDTAGDRPAAVDYDDSSWSPVKLEERIHADSCWVRRRIVLPRFLFGEPLHGALKLSLGTDDYGFVFVNGQAKGRIDWTGEIELTPEARPGDAYVVAIHIVNTGGSLRIFHA